MQAITTAIPDLILLEPRVFGDARGFFFEAYNRETFARLGIGIDWIQDNHSRSAAGVLRGLHYQRGTSAQDKLVRVTAGTAFDVALDLRRAGATFGRWFGVELSAENKRQLFIPRGFAHGFLALAEGTEVQYKCSQGYDPAAERGIIWNDPDLAVAWPLASKAPLLSERDRIWPRLSAVGREDLF